MSEQNDLEDLKHGPAYTGVNDLILKRWSPRAFTGKAVSKADLKKIFTAASWAASSYNEQPWRFLLGIKEDAECSETYQKIFNSLLEMNQAWAKEAPVLVATIAKKTFTHNGTPNRVAIHDVGAASANMCLQAMELGIHTHGMAGFNPETLRSAFNIPHDFEPVAVWAIGYLGNPDSLPAHFQEMERAPRSRKELDDVLFAAWDKTANI